MTPLEVGPAIDRLLMLAGATHAHDDGGPFEQQLAAFDSDTVRRELVWQLVLKVTDQMPDGGVVLMTDGADMIAFGLIGTGQASGPQLLSDTIQAMPEPLVGPVAIALLAMWHGACHQRADRELARVTIPDSPDAELHP